jgi:predicted DNA-binding transcriptional regulator AlpA
MSTKSSASAKEPRFLDYGELAFTLGVHKTTIFRWVKAGRLPPPVYLTPTKPAFVRAEIEQFITDRSAMRAQNSRTHP